MVLLLAMVDGTTDWFRLRNDVRFAIVATAQNNVKVWARVPVWHRTASRAKQWLSVDQ